MSDQISMLTELMLNSVRETRQDTQVIQDLSEFGGFFLGSTVDQSFSVRLIASGLLCQDESVSVCEFPACQIVRRLANGFLCAASLISQYSDAFQCLSWNFLSCLSWNFRPCER